MYKCRGTDKPLDIWEGRCWEGREVLQVSLDPGRPNTECECSIPSDISTWNSEANKYYMITDAQRYKDFIKTRTCTSQADSVIMIAVAGVDEFEVDIAENG